MKPASRAIDDATIFGFTDPRKRQHSQFLFYKWLFHWLNDNRHDIKIGQMHDPRPPKHRWWLSVQELQWGPTLTDSAVSISCRKKSTTRTHVHIAEVPNAIVLQKEAECKSEIINMSFTSGAETLFYASNHIWYIKNCMENACRKSLKFQPSMGCD